MKAESKRILTIEMDNADDIEDFIAMLQHARLCEDKLIAKSALKVMQALEDADT